MCKITVCGSLAQNACVGMPVSEPSRATCARPLSEDYLCTMFVSESPKPNPVGALVQDRCMRISCARCLCQDLLSKTTCARSLYAILYDHLCKISVCGSLAQDVVRDLCMRISCALCLRSPQQNPEEALAQDRCMRISCARCLCQDLLSRTTCARPLYAALLSKISLSGSLRQDPVVGKFVRDHCMRIS